MIKFNKGFSLVELSIVLVIIGVLVAMSLSLGSGQVGVANIKATRTKLDRIEEAMQTYFQVNNALPCPAAGSAANGSATYGVGSATPPVTDGTADNVTCANANNNYQVAAGPPVSKIYFGVVPTRDLGLSDDYMLDAWGNRITYAVSSFCVDPDDWNNNNKYKCAQDTTGTSTTQGSNITIQDLAGNAHPAATNAAYVLVSHGKDGIGAWTRPGTSRITGSSTTSGVEKTNAHFASNGTTDSYNGIFADGFITDGTVAANYFDDILHWKPGQIFESEATATNNPCSELSPIITGVATANYYYPCAAKSTAISGAQNNNSFGTGAGASLVSGTDNIFMGVNAGAANTTASNNIMMGNNAGAANTTGTYNIMMGNYAGTASKLGTYNVLIGNGAGAKLTGASGSGDNTFVGGNYVGGNTTTGDSNTFLGFQTGQQNVTGSDNVYVGEGTATNQLGSNNVIIGEEAAIGTFGTPYVSSNSVIIGQDAGYNIGLGSGGANTSDNTLIGFSSGHGSTPVTKESSLTLIGSQSNISTANIYNSTAIGYNATVGTSNTVVLGNTSITSTQLNGIITFNNAGNIVTTNTGADDIANLLAAGADSNATLMGEPKGFITVNIGGTNYRMPYYTCGITAC